MNHLVSEDAGLAVYDGVPDREPRLRTAKKALRCAMHDTFLAWRVRLTLWLTALVCRTSSLIRRNATGDAQRTQSTIARASSDCRADQEGE
jgi:hypothetical protein